MDKKWITKSSKIVFDNKWIKIREDVTELDGKESTYTVAVRHNSVSIIPMSSDNHILLIKQLRYPTQQISYEVPAGGIMEGEETEDAALRELKEETGLTSQQITKISELYPIPSLSAQKSYVYLAKVTKEDMENAKMEDKEEAISDYLVLPLEEVYKMVAEGKITDGYTLSSLICLRSHLEKINNYQ